MLQSQSSLASHILTTERRKDRRSDVLIHTHLMVPGRRLVEIEIGNISPGGLFAICAEPLNERDKVRIDIPSVGWTRATVTWAMQDQHGFTFESELNDAVFAAIWRMYQRSI